MQLAIILLAWLYSSILTTWPGAATFATFRLRGYANATRRANNVQDRLLQTNQYSALTSGLVEYQKAQAYFAITMQGTAMIALGSDGSIFDAMTYKEIGYTVVMLGDVAAVGVVCLTFGLYLLYKAKKTSWYVTTLTILAALLCFVTWSQTRSPLDNLTPRTPPVTNISSCGGLVTPVKFCTAFTTTNYSTKIEASIISCCATVLLVLIIRQGRHILGEWYKSLTTIISKRSEYSFPLKIRPSTYEKLSNRKLISRELTIRTTHAFTEVILAIAAIIMLVWLAHPHSLGYKYVSLSNVQNTQWTFGQMIAITIWAPSIIEYIHSAFRKSVTQHSYGLQLTTLI